MRNDLGRRIPRVNRRLEDLHTLARNLGPPQAAFPLLAFPQKHRPDLNFDPARIPFYATLTRAQLNNSRASLLASQLVEAIRPSAAPRAWTPRSSAACDSLRFQLPRPQSQSTFPQPADPTFHPRPRALRQVSVFGCFRRR